MTRWMVRIAILVACGLWIGAASMRAHAQRAQAQTGDAQILTRAVTAMAGFRILRIPRGCRA
jgi:hypothetical protein